jgi:hypothetical protein
LIEYLGTVRNSKLILLAFFLIFSFSTLTSLSQKADTTRRYIYETVWKRWDLIVRNNKTFVFIDNKYLDTLSGSLEKKGNDFLFVVDTSNFDKYQYQVYSNFVNSIKLTFYHPFKAPIVFPAIDTTKRLYNRDYIISAKLQGSYLTGDGFGGYGIIVKQNDTIAFYQRSDVGGKEPDINNKWARNEDIIQVVGENTIASWITDKGKLYILPFFLIGKKTVKGKGIYIETYRYFTKGAD